MEISILDSPKTSSQDLKSTKKEKWIQRGTEGRWNWFTTKRVFHRTMLQNARNT